MTTTAADCAASMPLRRTHRPEWDSARSSGRDDLREYGQVVVGTDEVAEPVAFASGSEVLSDLVGAADEDRWHLPDRLGLDSTPTARSDQVLGTGSAGVCEYERGE